MKRWLAFLLMAWCQIIGYQKLQAQYVTIPDANFVNWLQNNGYDSCMNGNQLDAACMAVVSTTQISCISQGIVDLTGVEAFVNLQVLICGYNQITALTNLPTSLTSLHCSNNQLTTIPDLPSSLLFFDCSYNPLTTLGSLPPSLMELRCSNNQLTALPTLPTTWSG